MINSDNATTENEGLDLRSIFAVLMHRGILIIACTVLAAVITFVVSSLLPKVYESSTTLFIQPAQSTTANEYDTMLAASKQTLTYSEMIKSRTVLDQVISDLQLKETPTSLAKKIVIGTVADSQLIKLSVTDSSPVRVADIANTIAEVFIKQNKALQTDQYASSLKMTQGKMDRLNEQIEDTKSTIDKVNKEKVDYDVEISGLTDQLNDYQSNLRLLQQNSLDIQLTLAQSANIVRVMDEARLVTVSYPITASVMLQINQMLGTGADNYSESLTSERLASTFTVMLQNQAFLEEAIKKSGLDIKPTDLSPRVRVELVTGTQMIKLSVWDVNGNRAQKMTNAIAQTFVMQTQALIEKPYLDRQAALQKEIDDLTTQINQIRASIKKLTSEKTQLELDLDRFSNTLAEYRNNYQILLQDYDKLLLAEASSADAIVVSEPARAPIEPSDRRAINTVLGLMIGLVIGIGLAFLVERIEDKIRTKQDIHKALGVYPLTTVMKFAKANSEAFDGSLSGMQMAEEFLALGTKIRQIGSNVQLRTILVTSPLPSEGKSFTVVNLAIALARTGIKVVVVDADLRFPRIHTLFGVDQGVGLSDLIYEGNDGQDVKFAKAKGVYILTSGNVPADRIGLLTSPNCKKLLDGLSKIADIVLIDCPPVLPVSDAAILASYVDGVMMILRADKSKCQSARDAAESLAKVNARFVGVVLNAAEGSKEYYGGYRSEANEQKGALVHYKNQAQSLMKAFQKRS